MTTRFDDILGDSESTQNSHSIPFEVPKIYLKISKFSVCPS